MRALACALLVACADPRFVLLSTNVPPLADPPAPATYTLANGMQIAVLRDPTARVASIDLRVEVGTGDDPPGRPGIAAELGYLMTETPEPALHTQLAVDADRTEITSTTLTLDAAIEAEAHRLELTCDQLIAPGLDRAHGEIAAHPRATPLATAIWGAGHPYAPAAIERSAAAAPTSDELCAFYRDHYVPAAATLVVTGPVDAGLLSRLRSRFERLPARAVAARAPVAPVRIEHVQQRVRGLATALAARVVPIDPEDDIIAQLAARRIASWDEHLHAFVTGGRRARALVVAFEGSRSRLDELLQRANQLSEDDADGLAAEDFLDEQLHLEDVLLRAQAIADDLAEHRHVDRLRRLRTLRGVSKLRIWIRDHVTNAQARVLDLVPDGPASAPVEDLGVAPVIVDDDRPTATTSYAPLAAAPRIEQWTLANGLHVILAPMPGTATVDVRLVLPVGTRQEPTPGVAQRAAAELIMDTGGELGLGESKKLGFYRASHSRSEIAVTGTTTRFRFAGPAWLADYHVFIASWLMTTGHYESDTASTLDPMRRFYGPRGAQLIVAGAFDPGPMHAKISTWFDAWSGGDPIPPPAPRSRTEAVGITDTANNVELGINYAQGATPRAEATLLAQVLDLRLRMALDAFAVVQASYDGRGDGEIVIHGDVDPGATGLAGQALAGETLSMCARPVAPAELDHAIRRVVAARLEASSVVAGRARQLEETAATPAVIEQELARLPNVHPDEIVTACQRSLGPDNRRVVARGPHGSVAILLAAMGIDPRRTVFTATR